METCRNESHAAAGFSSALVVLRQVATVRSGFFLIVALLEALALRLTAVLLVTFLLAAEPTVGCIAYFVQSIIQEHSIYRLSRSIMRARAAAFPFGVYALSSGNISRYCSERPRVSNTEKASGLTFRAADNSSGTWAVR